MPYITAGDGALAQLITDAGARHGITDTHPERLSHDLLEFLETV